MLTIICIVKDPVNFHHWLSWHSRIAEEILIYDHDSINPEPERGNIKVFKHKDHKVPSDREHGLQPNVYNFLFEHCKTDFVLPIDDDEYVFGDIHKSLREMSESVGAIRLCRKTFGHNGHVKTEDVDPVSHYKFYTDWDYGTKTVSRSNAVKWISTHSTYLKEPYIAVDSSGKKTYQGTLHLEEGGEVIKPVYDNVWINHYRYLSYDDVIRKSVRGSLEFTRSDEFYNRGLEQIYQLRSFASKEAFVKTSQPVGVCYYRDGILINHEFNVL